jgi:hypothetical protein
MKRFFSALAGVLFALSGAHAQSYLFTVPTTAVGVDETFGTVYGSQGARAAVELCSPMGSIYGVAHVGNLRVPFSTNNCTVVVGDKIVILPNPVTVMRVDVSLLGVDGSNGPTSSPDGTYSITTGFAANDRTVYFGNGRMAVIKVCTTTDPVTVVAQTGANSVTAKITTAGDCATVVGTKVDLERYTAPGAVQTFDITILGVSGIYRYEP